MQVPVFPGCQIVFPIRQFYAGSIPGSQHPAAVLRLSPWCVGEDLNLAYDGFLFDWLFTVAISAITLRQ